MGGKPMTDDKVVENKDELKTEFLDVIKELEKANALKEAVVDNKIQFKIKDVKYQVRKPSFDEQAELEKVRREKYLEFLDDDTMKFKKQWIAIYLKRGIDINAMDSGILTLQTEIDTLLIKLATTTDEADVKELKKVIEKKQDEQAALNIEKTDLLAYSIEDALMLHSTAYYTYLVLERLVDNVWARVFDSYQAFASCTNAELINNALYNVNYLIYSAPLS